MLQNLIFLYRTAGFAVATGLLTGWLLTSGTAFAQTVADGSSQQAVMKIEESTHKLTLENQETKQVIVSKVYDTQDPLGNSYLLRVSDSNKAVVIDPGYNYEAITKYLGQMNVDVEAILLTNGGFLRIAGNEELRKKWPNATILIGDQDAGLLTDPKANMSSEFGGVTSPIANVWLKDGDAFEIAGLPISVVGTPGFTSGSLTYVLPTDDASIAFTGDFIYKEGISSGNMPSSSEDELHKSLDHFLETQFAETLVFPGHGDNTSVTEFYQQMTGKSVSVIQSDTSVADNSPVIIVERDPETVVVTQPVYVPTVEYRTETIVVDRYARPWVNVGVGIPLWSSWYRPWYDYYSYRPMPLSSFYLYSRPYGQPFLGLYFGGGYYPPPLIAPPRPGRPVLPPNFTQPPRRDPFRPGQPGPGGSGPGRPGFTPGQPGPGGSGPGRPATPPGLTPPGRPGPNTGPEIRPPRPDQIRPNRPGQQTTQSPLVTPRAGTLSAPATPAPATRPAPPATRPSTPAATRPAPPTTRPSTPPATRPAPTTQASPPSATRSAPTTRSSTPTVARSAPAAQASPRPATSSTSVSRPAATPRASTGASTGSSRPSVSSSTSSPRSGGGFAQSSRSGGSSTSDDRGGGRRSR